jgi:DNA-binding NarL/FixJ family response regulator
MASILVVGDGDSFSEIFQELFRPGNSIRVLAESKSYHEITQEAARLQPDLIILESAPAGQNLSLLTSRIRQVVPCAVLFMMADTNDFQLERQAISVGITAVFSREDGYSSLVENAKAICSPG